MEGIEYQIIDARQRESDRYIHFAHRPGTHDLSVVQYGWQEPWKSYAYGPMVRDHYLIHFIRKGSGTVIAGDAEYRVRAGECFMIYPHQIAYYQADENDPWEYYWLGFEGREADEIVQACGFKPDGIARTLPLKEDIFTLLALPCKIDLTEETGFMICGLCGQIMGLMAMFPNTQSAVTARSERWSAALGNEYVRIVKSIIENSYQEQLSVEAIARHMGLSRGYLTTLFKAHTGMSIKEYLLDYRLQQSILRLQYSKYTVQRAALESGFTDALYYSRLFKARMGTSPSEYRQIVKEKI